MMKHLQERVGRARASLVVERKRRFSPSRMRVARVAGEDCGLMARR